MHIQEAGLDDIPIIRDIAYNTWPHAYGKIISTDQLTYMLQMIYDPASLAVQMQKGQQFYILSEGVTPVGFAAVGLRPEESPVTYRLYKLYVLPAMHGKGYGKFLLDYVIDIVNNKGAAKIDLTVNRENPAQYFYHKSGFQISREEDTDIGNGFFMNDYVMERLV